MAPTHPVPDQHGEYDAHFLRSCIAEQHDVTRLQLTEEATSYVNPWLVPWHLRPRCDQTSLCIGDFSEDVKRRLIQVMECDPHELRRAEHLLRHISHTIVQHAAALHTQKITRDDLLAMTRRDLMCVFQRGVFVAETPSHPYWQQGQSIQLQDDTFVRFAQRKPTTVDKQVARYLAGPDVNISGPRGRIGEILERAQPALLSLETRQCVQYALELRRRLARLLDGKQVFTPEDQRMAIEWIADAWHASLPPRALTQLHAHVHDWSRPVPELIERHFSSEMLAEREMFESRRFLLEQLTIMRALEAHGSEEIRVREDLELLFGVWWEAMARHQLALCDYPTLGLAFLAGNARYSTPPEFVRHLGTL